MSKRSEKGRGAGTEIKKDRKLLVVSLETRRRRNRDSVRQLKMHMTLGTKV